MLARSLLDTDLSHNYLIGTACSNLATVVLKIHLKVCFFSPSLGADTLLTKLVDKIGATSSHGRLIVAHMPLIMVCLEGVGKLAEKFPMLAKQVC